MPAKSLALAEDFSRHGGGHRLVVGNRDLLLYETTFPIGRRRCTPLYQGLERDGLITTISWNGVHIAFTNESGTRIYDMYVASSLCSSQVLPGHSCALRHQSHFTEVISAKWDATSPSSSRCTKSKSTTLPGSLLNTPGSTHQRSLLVGPTPSAFVA